MYQVSAIAQERTGHTCRIKRDARNLRVAKEEAQAIMRAWIGCAVGIEIINPQGDVVWYREQGRWR